MYRSKHKIMLEKKITNEYCKKYSVVDISKILKPHNNHRLWDKPKPMWNVADWEEFLTLIINNYET